MVLSEVKEDQSGQVAHSRNQFDRFSVWCHAPTCLIGGNTIDSGGAELSVCQEIRRRRPTGSLAGICL